MESVVNEVFNQASRIAQQFFELIAHVIGLIWSWTFGQFGGMFHLPFMTLPLWKQVLYVLVIIAIAYILYRVGRQILETILKIVRAIVELVVTLIEKSLDVLIVGVAALVVAWIVTNLGSVPFLDNLHL
jgi:hypothetical protein